MAETTEWRRFDRILDWDVSSKAREIRYIYYDFVMVYWRKTIISRIQFNERDVQYMLDRINKTLKIIYERKSPVDELDGFFNGEVRLDEERIESCDSQYISDLFIAEFRYRCLSDADWSWLSKGNQRAVDLIWSFISGITREDLFLMLNEKLPLMRYHINNFPGAKEVYEREVVPYKLMHFDYDLIDVRLKYDSILAFFDFLNLFGDDLGCKYNINAKMKANVIGYMKQLWLFSIEDDSMLRWASKNKKYLYRAWQYYLKTMEDGLIPAWFCSKYSEDYTRPLILAYDLLSSDYSCKKLFMSRLAKACAQEKYRENLPSKKQVSFSIRTDVKDKLDKLAERQGKKLYELIEQLIEREYEIHNKK